jgi:predicted nucleic acid-binding protein
VYLLDTSVLSQPIKNHPHSGAMERWDQLPDGDISTSALCLAELLQGLEARKSPIYWRRYQVLLEPYFSGLPFNGEVAQTYARLHANLRAVGSPKPTMDLLIASTAVHHRAVLATLNVKDFLGIPGLLLEDWSQ